MQFTTVCKLHDSQVYFIVYHAQWTNELDMIRAASSNQWHSVETVKLGLQCMVKSNCTCNLVWPRVTQKWVILWLPSASMWLHVPSACDHVVHADMLTPCAADHWPITLITVQFTDIRPYCCLTWLQAALVK